MWRYALLAIVVLAANHVASNLLAVAVGNALDISREFNQQLLVWHEQGKFPYPSWVLLLFPRLRIWSVWVELAYHVAQTALWACNGYLLRRYAPNLRPTSWIWLPPLVHLLNFDPPQMLLGALTLYLFASPAVGWRTALLMPTAARRAWLLTAAGLLAALTIAAITYLRSPSAESLLPEKRQRLEELLPIAQLIRDATVAGDIETLLQYSPTAAQRGESPSKDASPRLYGTREADRRLLGDTKSWLYCLLFDATCLREQAHRLKAVDNPYYRTAIRDFLSKRPAPEIRILFLESRQRQENLDRATILYVRPGAHIPPVISEESMLPSSRWGEDFVGVSLIRTEHGWRYWETVFTIETPGPQMK